jgi:hypothetical protein
LAAQPLAVAGATTLQRLLAAAVAETAAVVAAIAAASIPAVGAKDPPVITKRA